ncbi:thioredoxin domain-containing protein [Streptomyces sp. NPDC051776]|uniref:DsbA family protein n=1 Tax=Streptomyces sp. NPDC051776 TaxID=3155414 RepID=UPI003440721D
MSEKNRDGKRSARERLQMERERDRVRDKRRRTLFVGVVGVVVLGIAAGVGFAVSQVGDDEDGPVVAPTGANGENNLAIPVGRSTAPSSLTVYEDFRCPACGQFENGFRDTIHSLQNRGLLRTDYHLATIIDGNMGGTGSHTAANAAACAQDAGKFQAYHDVLYRNQPPEEEDAFADKAHLIHLAGQVKGLATPAFKKCVNDGSHDSWVEKSNSEFTNSGHQGTPTVLLNGKNVYSNQKNPLTPEKLTKMVEDAARKKS